VDSLKYYHFRVFDSVIVSRTGYTGEDGFEVYAKLEDGIEIFRKIIEEAKPCGLASRDILRIEAGLALYGHEISEDITPVEASLDRFISFEKNFLGKEAILTKEVRRKLFGLELLERGIPREGYRIYLSGNEIGYVSSGTYSYTLEKGIALCFVDINLRKENLEVEIEVRGKRLKALLRSYPFLRKL
ncbi:MAG: aminomethyltransferase family protein, partial [Aquificaceae bacterium]